MPNKILKYVMSLNILRAINSLTKKTGNLKHCLFSPNSNKSGYDIGMC